MNESETLARTGEDLSPAQELKAALAGFAGEVKTFATDIQQKIQQQDDRMTKLDRKSLTAARPALSATAEMNLPHQNAFSAYLRTGDDGGLRGLEFEGKALSTAVAADGGYLVDPQTSGTVASVLTGAASLRSIATVVQVNAASFDVLADRGEIGAAWGSEAGAANETATPKIDRISIPLHELSALPKASQRLLDDAAFDVEGWLAERIAAKFARAEAAAFVTGTGVEQPAGLLSYGQVDNSEWEWGQIGTVKTGFDGGFSNPAADALIDLVYSLAVEYRANGTFVMNSNTAAVVRKLKDADGRFLWADNLASGEPARLLGRPVLISEEMPNIASGTTAIAFGDFRAGYTIAERPDLRVLRDPFSAKPHVLFYATKRVGGGVSDFAAIKLLKFSA